MCLDWCSMIPAWVTYTDRGTNFDKATSARDDVTSLYNLSTYVRDMEYGEARDNIRDQIQSY